MAVKHALDARKASMTPDLGSEVPAAREAVIPRSVVRHLASIESDDGGLHNTVQVIRPVPDGSRWRLCADRTPEMLNGRYLTRQGFTWVPYFTRYRTRLSVPLVRY